MLKYFSVFAEVFYWKSENSAVMIDMLKYFSVLRRYSIECPKIPQYWLICWSVFRLCGGGILSNIPKFRRTDCYAEVFFGFAEEVFYWTSQNFAVLIDMLKCFSVLRRYSIEHPKIRNPRREKKLFLLTTFFKIFNFIDLIFCSIHCSSLHSYIFLSDYSILLQAARHYDKAYFVQLCHQTRGLIFTDLLIRIY